MADDTLLCGKRGDPGAVTVKNYVDWEKENDRGWSKKPQFIRQRLCDRYVNPVRALDLHPDTKDKKNGFYIMAVSCLLIETLVSFWRGWPTTAATKKHKGKSERAFKMFFRLQPGFSVFRGTKFYKNVRCGILHQGETTGGWLVERSGRLFDGQKRINAKIFHDQLALAIDDYVAALERPKAGSKLRQNFDKKMKAVIKNCD